MSLYQPGIPTGTVKLNIDYKNIQDNFQQLNITYGVDHIPFDDETNQNGYHTSVHFNPVSVTTGGDPINDPPINPPPAVLKTAQLFGAEINDGFGADSALFYLSGLDNQIQMTMNFLPNAGLQGYTFLPGGIVIQWGFIARPGGGWDRDVSQTYNFVDTGNLNYPNRNFVVYTTMYGANTQASQGTVYVITKPTTGFTWAFSGSATNTFLGFHWLSIGN